MISHAGDGTRAVLGRGFRLPALLASSTWLGALVMLVAAPAMAAAIRRRTVERFLYLANAFDRFSIVAGISVIVVLATGTFNGLTEIPNARAMIHTTYGKVLLAKLVLIIPLLAVAASTRSSLKPRLVASIDALYQQGGRAARSQRAKHGDLLSRLRTRDCRSRSCGGSRTGACRVRRGQRAEPERRRPRARSRRTSSKGDSLRSSSQSATAGDLKLSLEVTPNRVGLNEYDVDDPER